MYVLLLLNFKIKLVNLIGLLATQAINVIPVHRWSKHDVVFAAPAGNYSQCFGSRYSPGTMGMVLEDMMSGDYKLKVGLCVCVWMLSGYMGDIL